MNIFNKKKILVTGGAGFIGSWLAKELINLGAEVAVLDLKTSSPILDGLPEKPIFIKGNVQNYRFIERVFKKLRPEFVFHLAAQTIVGLANKYPLQTLKSNIAGTWNVLEVVRHYPVRAIIIASSDKAYGENSVIPYTEDSPLKGLHPYDCSKSSADLLSQMYCRSYQVPVGIIRSGNVFGGGDLHFSRIVPDTIRSAFYGKRPIIRSDGTYLRDYIYIKDTVRGYLALAENLENVKGQAFNLGADHPYTVKKITEAILRLMEKSDLKPIILNEVKNEIKNQSLNFAKARKFLGWSPRYSLRSGLKETIQWYTQYFKGKKR